MTSKELNERRRGDLQNFLTTTNTKAAVFRDIIIESGKAQSTCVAIARRKVLCFGLKFVAECAIC